MSIQAKTFFSDGCRYRVLRDFKVGIFGGQQFLAGEEFFYRGDYFSRYDGFRGFSFQKFGTDEFRQIEIAERDTVPDWSELFEEIKNDETPVA